VVGSTVPPLLQRQRSRTFSRKEKFIHTHLRSPKPRTLLRPKGLQIIIGTFTAVSLAHNSTAAHTRPNGMAQQIHIFKIVCIHQDHLSTSHTCCLLIIHDSSRPLHQSVGDDTSKRPPCLHRFCCQDIPTSDQSRCLSATLFRTTSFCNLTSRQVELSAPVSVSRFKQNPSA
jgi:hypothetical protein